VIDLFNGGHGVAVVDSLEYRIAFSDQRGHSGWITHSRLHLLLEERGHRHNSSFHFAYVRPGFPLQPGRSLRDRHLFLAQLTQDTLKAFRILDVRIRVRDQVGDLHERVLPCRAVFTQDLVPSASARQPAKVPAPRTSLLSALLSVRRR
jgi:hypothetical protein